MSADTAIAPAPAGELNDADALAAFAEFAAAKPTNDPDPAPEVTDDTTPEPTPAAPAADATPTPTPAAPAPAAAATDIWSSASPEARAAHEADLERERQRYRSDIGRQSAYQARIRFLEDQLAGKAATPAAATAPPPATPTSLREMPDIKKSIEDYPEVVNPLLNAIEPVIAENARLGRELSTISDARRADVIASQEQALDEAHPDWRVKCASKDFADWLNAQPAAIKQIVQRNGEQVVDAAEAIAMVGNFKAHFALTHPQSRPAPTPAPAAPTNLQARRDAQLRAVTTTPKGAPVAIPDGAPGGEDAALFNHYAAKKAKKG